MKNTWKKTFSLLLAAMLSAEMMLAAGCTAAENTSSQESSGISGEKEDSSQEESSAPSSSESSAEESEEVSSEAPASSAESSEEPESSEEVPVKTFEEKFEENQLDAAFEEASLDAVTNKEMVDLFELYTSYWEQEVDLAYDKLLELSDNDPAFIEEQNTWINGREEAMNNIADQVAGIKGSMAAVEAGGMKLNYFRNRAMEIYQDIYTYDPNFTFQVSIVG